MKIMKTLPPLKTRFDRSTSRNEKRNVCCQEKTGLFEEKVGPRTRERIDLSWIRELNMEKIQIIPRN